tara:strand:+ start:865 stop:1842 length:978 start_codon:yes stop_codon:yes gene_type:complete
MKIAFLTEMGFSGTIPPTHNNMRTEFAWMNALNAVHYPLVNFKSVTGYDVVFIIFPKGKTYLNSEGSKLVDGINPVSQYLEQPLVPTLKENNTKVYYIQEGPHWWWNDYEVIEQIQFYNFLSLTDGIFAHNLSDSQYYRGLFWNKKVEIIHSLMIEDFIKDIQPITEDKVLIGGNFSRWYGGFESYMVASEFGLPIWGQESHSKRVNEGGIGNLSHFPRMNWNDWMVEVSKFKYGVHLMPTVAAGTFSLNCAYFGIPVIGNEKVDTQRLLHPNLSVDVSDIESAMLMVEMLKDPIFYKKKSEEAKDNYQTYYTKEVWLTQMMNKI